ncbi:MAG: hypothetical protein ACK4TA_15610 [Saprospiraceae bacterium]
MESLKSFIGGIAATVIGGLLVFYILQQQGVFQKGEPPTTPEVIPEAEPLEENDALFSYHSPTITFYESGDSTIGKEARQYTTRFDSKNTRYINWELTLKYDPVGVRKRFGILAIFRKADGTEVTRQTLDTYVEKDWGKSYHTWGWGSAAPGFWQKGNYTVELYIGGNKVIEGQYEVY